MEAMITATKKISGPSAGHHWCPVCKRAMVAVDSSREDDFSYIWYECKDVHCDGQWLEKKPVFRKGVQR